MIVTINSLILKASSYLTSPLQGRGVFHSAGKTFDFQQLLLFFNGPFCNSNIASSFSASVSFYRLHTDTAYFILQNILYCKVLTALIPNQHQKHLLIIRARKDVIPRKYEIINICFPRLIISLISACLCQ
ncbi:MAG: hypothetical protein ACI90Q_001469 [Nonlabens sp.]|jgi:hypothetical protein